MNQFHIEHRPARTRSRVSGPHSTRLPCLYIHVVALALIATAAGLTVVHAQSDPPVLETDCAGSNCGALPSAYKGKGVGVWAYSNDQSQPQTLSIDIDGLRNNEVTIVLSNPGNQTAKFAGDLARRREPTAAAGPALSFPETPVEDYPLASSSEKHTWKVPQLADSDSASARQTPSTLRAQATIRGFRYRIWVADEQWTPHMQKQLPKVATLLFGSKRLPGLLQEYASDFRFKPWGAYPHVAKNAGQIPATVKDINFVIAPNGAGNAQFFDSSQTGSGAQSNRALVLFVGSDALTCKDMPIGMCGNMNQEFFAFALSDNLLHELTHLIDHYQRHIKPEKSQVFDRWLKEAVASSHGFVVASTRFPRIDPRLTEIAGWFGGNYGCPLVSAEGEDGTPVSDQCSQNYYSSGQAFLLYLVHLYGTGFYQKLELAPGTGVDAVDAAIRASGGTGFKEDFRRWGGTLALLPVDALDGYGYPGVRVGTRKAPPIDTTVFAAVRRLPPASGIAPLAPYSHSLIVDAEQSGRYKRTVIVPPQTSVTVLVKESEPPARTTG